MYQEARAIEKAVPEEFAAIWAILMYHYASLLSTLKRYNDAEREAKNLINLGQREQPVLSFLGHHNLGRIALAKASDPLRQGRAAKKNPPIDYTAQHLTQAEKHLDHCPTQDLTIVSALFMAQFHRMSGNLEAADRYLQRAEEAAATFLLLKTDCLLERAWFVWPRAT